jgi:hypothetical protein
MVIAGSKDEPQMQIDLKGVPHALLCWRWTKMLHALSASAAARAAERLPACNWHACR